MKRISKEETKSTLRELYTIPVKPANKELLDSIKVGNIVERMLGGYIPINLKVKRVTENEIILCVYKDEDHIYAPAEWRFNKRTGAEIDETLGWDGVTITGSYITKIIDNEDTQVS